jgi:peptidoglycan/xylan/chitin deacetylase (PgdA/CDA1 family)
VLHRWFAPARGPLGIAALASLASLALAACGDSPTEPDPATDVPAAETREIQPPVLSSTRESSPLMSLASCSAPTTYKLTNIRHTPGTVTVTNDASKLYVTYQITKDDWFISDTRLAVAKKYEDIPQDHRRRPLPWSFPYVGEHEPVVTSVTYALSLAELGVEAGDNVVVAAMAGVVHPKHGRYDGPWEWLVVWGIGNLSGRNIETIHNYTITDCGEPEPTPPATGGIFTLTFDDGWTTTHTNVLPVLRDFGMTGNVAVNPQPIDDRWNGYMTLAQLRDLHDAGWSIVSHSMTHRDLTTLSDDELHGELRDSKAWLQRHGFGPTDVFVVPFHRWGDRERAAIQQYYSRARGYSANQFVPDMLVKYPVTRPYDITGFEPEFAPFTTVEGRERTLALVRRAIEQGEVIDLFFHQITTEQLPAFRTLMMSLAQYKANLRTWGQFSAAPVP